MTLPRQYIGADDLPDQIIYRSPGYKQGDAQTVWVYYGGAWFNPTAFFTKGPVKDYYSGYYIDPNPKNGSTGSGVGVPSGSVTTLLIAPEYRWVEGWDLNTNRIEGPLAYSFFSDDLINGLNNRDQVFTGPGDDTLYLNGGDDWGIAGDGSDTIHGGSGNDLIHGDWTNAPVYVTPNYNPSSDMMVTNQASILKVIWDFELPSVDSPARMKHFDEGGNFVDGEPEGNDLLFGDEGSDTIYGGPGNDQLNGGPRGSGWTDVLYGGDGADMFYLSYETDSSTEQEQDSWWEGWGEEAAAEAGQKTTAGIVKKLAEVAAEEFFKSMVGGVLLGGVTGAIGASVAFGIKALFNKSTPETPPITGEDVMIVADFDPRVDALFLPMEEGKTLTAEAKYLASSPAGLTGWGATFSTIDATYAEVFLSDDFLNEFGISSKRDVSAIAFIDNVLSNAVVVGETGMSGQDAAYPFQNLDASDYTDGVVPEYADTAPLDLETPAGTEATIFGAIAPVKVLNPEINDSLAKVAGTNMGDILSVNSSGFSPSEYRSAAVQLYDDASLVKGFGGDDIIFGGAGQDILHGGDGDDVLYSFQTAATTTGPLRESLYGEAGDDVLYTGGTAADLYGGSGTDTVSFAISPYAVSALLFNGTGTDMTHPDNTYNFASIENLEGSAYDDQFIGDGNDNVLSGLAGNDALTGAEGNDTIFGGDGYDSVRFAGGPGAASVDLAYNDGTSLSGRWVDAWGDFDTVDRASVEAYWGTPRGDSFKGDGGNSTYPLYSADFYGMAGNDTLVGSGLAELLDGGDDADLLQGLGGADTLTGGNGIDVFRDAAANWNGSIITDFDADETVTVEGFNATKVSFDAPGAIGATVMLDGVGSFQLLGADYDNKNLVVAQSGADAVISVETILAAVPFVDGGETGAGNDVLDGSLDADLLIGRGGDDRLNGNHGADIVRGRSGNDVIRGENGRDMLQGGAGDDTITGNDGKDTLVGGDGYDSLHAGRDDDRLSGGHGNDILDGGLGDDALRGDNGRDTVMGGEGDDDVQGKHGRDSVFGGDGDDVVSGGRGRDVAEGGAGDDVVNGDRGIDTVAGGDGDDTVDGGGGDDILSGGLGTDVLTGGPGADSFVLEPAGGTDIVTDFELGVDLIGLPDGVTFADLTRAGSELSLEGEALMILDGIETEDLGESVFVLV